MGTIKTVTFDAADFLNTKEDVAAYLEESFRDGDETIFLDALGAVARSAGMTQIAQKAGMSRESLYKALSQNGNPSFHTVRKVLDALGVEFSFRVERPVASKSKVVKKTTVKTWSRTRSKTTRRKVLQLKRA